MLTRTSRLAGAILAQSALLLSNAGADNWTTATAGRIISGNTTNVGIGEAAPSNLLHVARFGAEANIGLRRANGTAAAPTDVVSGNQLGFIEAQGRSGTGYQGGSKITFNVDGTFTSGQRMPSSIEFFTNTANAGQTANMVLKADGKVGIGITGPSAFLHLRRDAVTGELLRVEGNANGNNALKALSLRHSNSPAAGNLGQALHVDFSLYRSDIPGHVDAARIAVGKESDFTSTANLDAFMAFSTNRDGAFTEKMRLTSDGRFSLGTTTPLGIVHLQRDSHTGDMVRIQGNAGGNAALKALALRHGNTPSAGQTGQAVDIDFSFERADLGLQADAARIRVGKESDWMNTANLDSYLGIMTNSDGAFNERMRVTSKGWVGIGTSNPTSMLHVSGPGVGGGWSGIDLTNTVAPGHTFKLSAGIKDVNEGGFTIMDRTAGDKHRLVIDNNGYIGINNPQPAYNLDLFGTMRVYGSNAMDFTALKLRAGEMHGAKTRIAFTGDNNLDYAQIVGTSYGTGSPTGGTLVFRTRDGGTSDANMRDQLTITENGRFVMGGPGANLARYDFMPTPGSSGTNNGNGSSLMVAAGACDNADGKFGGTLYLRGGSKQAGGDNILKGNIGNVALADDGGRVGIGTDNPDANYKVDVRGHVKIVGDVTVASVRTNSWNITPPDYVFEKDYKLNSLENVEKFVKKNKHLPEIPSAKEMTEKGLDLTEMNFRLLKKVEELTLHAIRQEKEIRELRNAVNGKADR